MNVLISGSIVYLRHPTAADAKPFSMLRAQSRDFLAPWEPIPDDGSDAFHPSAYEGFLQSADLSHLQKHLICRTADHVIVGYVGLSQIVRGAFCSAYMGYWIGAPYVRRGYAAEGVGLCIARAFTQLGLHRVEANIVPTNAASIATVRRCGLRKEGYSPRYLKIAGIWQDHERWAITMEDWQALPR